MYHIIHSLFNVITVIINCFIYIVQLVSYITTLDLWLLFWHYQLHLSFCYTFVCFFLLQSERRSSHPQQHRTTLFSVYLCYYMLIITILFCTLLHTYKNIFIFLHVHTHIFVYIFMCIQPSLSLSPLALTYHMHKKLFPSYPKVDVYKRQPVCYIIFYYTVLLYCIPI